jgi:hypothetical protein
MSGSGGVVLLLDVCARVVVNDALAVREAAHKAGEP